MTAIVSVNNLKDYPVMDPLGETLGSIKDVVLDSDLGRARYFVLSYGGGLTLRHKLFAVPARAVRLDTENECLVIDVQQRQLEDAPPFDKHRWPRASEPGPDDRIYRFDEGDLPSRVPS